MIRFIVFMMLYFQKVKGDMFTMCDFHTHSLPLLLFPLPCELCHQMEWVVSKIVCVSRLSSFGERRDDSVSLCACLFAFSSLIFGLFFPFWFSPLSPLFSLSVSSLFSIELPLIHSLVVIVVKKEGKRNKRNLLCHKNVHLQCSLFLCVSSSRINRWLHRG